MHTTTTTSGTTSSTHSACRAHALAAAPRLLALVWQAFLAALPFLPSVPALYTYD